MNKQLDKIVSWMMSWSVLIMLFIGANVLGAVGYMVSEENAPSYQKLFPFVYLIILGFTLYFFNRANKGAFLAIRKQEVTFLVIIALILLYSIYKGFTYGLVFFTNNIIPGILLSMYLKTSEVSYLKKIQTIILTFFIINCGIAIVERVLVNHLFPPFIDRELDNTGFRSTGLQNHPLNNALITATIMAFIIVSDMPMFKKYILFFLGLTAVVCFGARSSLAICCLMIGIIFVLDMFKKSDTARSGLFKFIRSIILIIGLGGIYYLVTETSFGDRLMAHAYFDSSANVRLQVFDIFKVVSDSNLYWGMSTGRLDIVKQASHITIIENFWIIWILRLGLVMATIFTLTLLRFLFLRLKAFSLFNRLFIMGVFLGCASSNISLASVTAAISVFVACTYVFDPKMWMRNITVIITKQEVINEDISNG